MADSLARMLLAAHRRDGTVEPGADLTVAVDQILIEDATGSMCAMQFEALDVPRAAVPLAVLYVDHNVLQIDERNMAEHQYLRSFCARSGVRYSPPGNGISHYVHLERFARPGEVLLGADSHSTTAGAVGMVAMGAGGLEVAVAMAGHGYQLACPRVVVGAIFPSDERVRQWLAEQGRPQDFTELRAKPGATYDDHERIDLSSLEPLIAKPQSPGNVVPVEEVAGTPVVQVCVGSSVNSSYSDLATVAAVLGGAAVHPGVALTVTPGSRQILDTIGRTGVYRELTVAGARMLEPICGPCIGIGQAPTKGEASVRTFNRNFPGRSGTAEDQVYLCSPSTAAATALAGVITDPRTLGAPPRFRDVAPSDPTVVDRHISDVLPDGEAAQVTVIRGPNLVPPPLPGPCPDDVDGRVAVVVGDDISTADMAPDGAIGMSFWSDIEACARYLFRRIDPQFHDRVTGWADDGVWGIIVGGHNYGQGSSREHAALSPLHLGVPAVIAASFARIHRRNLIAQGIVPLVFADAADRGRLDVGDRMRVEGVRTAVVEGAEELSAVIDGGEPVPLRLQLTEQERAILAAGGLLQHMRGADSRSAHVPGRN